MLTSTESSMIDPRIPLVDLHRHLEGSIRLETILDLSREHGLELPAWDLAGLKPYVQVTEPQPGVMAFIAKMKQMTAILVDYDACRRTAYESVEDAWREGLDYLELRFSPWFMAESHGLDPVGIVEAVTEGVAQARESFGMWTNLIGILSRTYGPDIAQLELQALLHYKEQIVALDLAGDEANYPAEWFTGHYRQARDAGWDLIAHAGEAAGPESIWRSILDLGAVRIGHAVRAFEDPSLIEFMVENRIGVESSLTSNVQTTALADYATHPLKRFLRHGVLATINTDDPVTSGIDLKYEYNIAAPAAGLDQAQIFQAQRNGLEIAFLSEEGKRILIDQKAGRK